MRTSSSQSKRLPAHARELALARARGMTLRDPTVSVRLSGFRRAGVGYGVNVPSDLDPAECDWSWTRGLEVLVFRRHEPSERLMRALHAIEDARPRRLLVVDVSDPAIISIVAPFDEDRRSAA
jgi:hypothetical protein